MNGEPWPRECRGSATHPRRAASLRSAAHVSHGVQFYGTDEDSGTDAVAQFLADASVLRIPAIVIARASFAKGPSAGAASSLCGISRGARRSRTAA